MFNDPALSHLSAGMLLVTAGLVGAVIGTAQVETIRRRSLRLAATGLIGMICLAATVYGGVAVVEAHSVTQADDQQRTVTAVTVQDTSDDTEP